jgi:shikimate kinase
MAHMQPHHKSILSLHANRVMNTLNRMQDLIRLCIALGSVWCTVAALICCSRTSYMQVKQDMQRRSLHADVVATVLRLGTEGRHVGVLGFLWLPEAHACVLC